MSGNLSLITFSSFLQSISLRNYETILRCVCDNTSYKILSLCIDKCQYLVSAFSRVWDYPKNENRAFRLTAGTLCFSGVGTHRICLPFYKEVGRAMSALNQRQSNSSPTPLHQLPQISPPSSAAEQTESSHALRHGNFLFVRQIRISAGLRKPIRKAALIAVPPQKQSEGR